MMDDDVYTNMFSNSQHLMNSSFYKLTPNLNNSNISFSSNDNIDDKHIRENSFDNQTTSSTSTTTTNIPYSSDANYSIEKESNPLDINTTIAKNNSSPDDEYIYDSFNIDYNPLNTSNNSSSYDGYIDDSYDVTTTPLLNENRNNKLFEIYKQDESYNVKNIEILNIYVKYMNINIDIFNINVNLYIETASILEKYFTYIFTSLYNCYNSNMELFNQFKINDINKNIYRNYNPLLDYMRYIYNIYENIVYNKINEIEKYMLTLEGNLMKHCWSLIQCIWNSNYYFKLSTNDSIKYYQNYKLHNVFDKIRIKLQYVFKIIYKNIY